MACAFFAAISPAFGQLGGPAILSRAEAPSSAAIPDISIRPYVSIAETYDTGLSNVGVTDTGELANQAAFGERLTFGLSGIHSWRRTKLGLTYRGSISHYSRSEHDSTNHSMLLGVQHQLSAHSILNVQVNGGIFKRDFGLLGLPQTSLYDPSLSNIPATDFFDNRTAYVSPQASLIIRKSARLSFSFGGGMFYTARRSRALYSALGESAGADVQYRLSRRNTIGAFYAYSHFGYKRIFGGSHVHSVAGAFSRQLTRRVEFSGYAGFSRPEITFVRSVPIDPAIVALLGITTGTRIVHTISYTPNIGARISRSMEAGLLYASASHAMNPGNGLFLVSESTMFSGGYTYTGLRRWSAGAVGSYNLSKSVGNITGEYRTASATASLSRSLRYSLHLTMSYSARKYLSDEYANYNRLIHQASIGLGWSPGEVPLRVW